MSEQPSAAAAGWSLFAAIILTIAGMFQIIAGTSAILKDNYIVISDNYVFQLNLTQWGWIHLGLGILLVLVGMGILSGNVVARTIGVIIAALSAIANFAFIPMQPLWAIVIIAIDIAVIWALTAHGRDVEMLN
ncbi:MAG: hypothetical protein EXQ71_11795 [Acidimicrobiia bacterium]|nr:hypothetical protein [Acidimicrobiia bacterium]